MNKAFENIISQIGELANYNGNAYLDSADVIEIVQEVAEEFATGTNVGTNGWIACIERLPDDFMSMEYLTTVKGHFYPEINYYCVVNHKWYSNEKSTKEVNVIAWQPLPECFKERD